MAALATQNRQTSLRELAPRHAFLPRLQKQKRKREERGGVVFVARSYFERILLFQMHDRRERKEERRGFDAAGSVAYTNYSNCRENSRLSGLFRKLVCLSDQGEVA